LREVLTNQEFGKSLVAKGMERASKFSWDMTAKQALKFYSEVEEGLQAS